MRYQAVKEAYALSNIMPADLQSRLQKTELNQTRITRHSRLPAQLSPITICPYLPTIERGRSSALAKRLLLGAA
jgi:hypothetical protein